MLSSGSAAISGIAPGSYNSEKQSTSNNDIDYGADVTVNGFFGNGQLSEFKKHDDLKQMLDSNKDGLKLEAMKRIIGMVAKGRDASDLFPAVVKNVVSKNIEVKKLVYVYLVRYAEEKQDLALLSISTFQRALKDPNQLIRASALRVLSSIRVTMIVPIVMLAIRESASDMSPYVRKTAAHAIPKLYVLDVEQKDELISVIEKLLSDRTTLVVGSAVMAWAEVCPERTDLIHKNYRKFCNLLVDVDEWGQVLIINMLTRYARTQFTDPNHLGDYEGEDLAADKPFYEETSSDDDANTEKKVESPKKTYSLDPDHRLLLRQTKPLLQSRNASVVMAVAQLYHHVAPKSEVNVVAKALIRLLRSHKEVQSIVLTGIASMSSQRKSIFDPYMKSFFVRTSDQTHIKLLKLDILTNLATEVNISIILREFQTYISSQDKDFVAATIQAIGRCAASIKEVSDTCLHGLVHLLSNRDEYVVAESVVVIKKLLQTQANEHCEIITKMAKLLDFIAVPAARASILWLLGEYNNRVPKIAPDVLRKLAKSFVDEQDVVKLQVLNLAVKLYLTNPAQTELLCQYVFSLARYDQNYDIRDRARFLKQIIFPSTDNPTILSKNAKNIFLAAKPAPTLKSNYCGREKYQLGSLSHFLNVKANGYQDLPEFPPEPSDSTVRDVEVQVPMDFSATMITRPDNSDVKSHRHHKTKGSKLTAKSRSFYSESEKSSSEEDDDEDENSSSGEESESESGSDSDSESSGENEKKDMDSEKEIKKSSVPVKPSVVVKKKIKVEISSDSDEESGTADSEDDSESDSDDASGSSSDDETSESPRPAKSSINESVKQKKSVVNKPTTNNQPKPAPVKSNLDLLLDLDMPVVNTVGSSIMTPSLGGFLTPLTPAVPKTINVAASNSTVELVGPQFVSPTFSELLNKVNGYGLGINFRYSRSPHLFSSTMVSIELQFTNTSNVEMTDVDMIEPKLVAGMTIHKFAAIDVLTPKQTITRILGVDFRDSTQGISLEMKCNFGTSKVTLAPSVGELIRSVQMQEDHFKKERAKLRGMTEHSCTMSPIPELAADKGRLQQRLYEVVNVGEIVSSEENVLHFAGETMSLKNLVLITIVLNAGENILISVNCEKIVVGSMLLNEIKAALKN